MTTQTVRSTVTPRKRPVFTTEHYRRIATTLARDITATTDRNQEWFKEWELTINRLVVMFQLDNPRFDRERFLTWCYGNV